MNARSTFVQIAQNIEAQDDHSHSKKDKAGINGEQWPVARIVRFEEVELGDDEENSYRTGDEVGYPIKEEELQTC
jgi:hypothetical protein